MRRDRARVIGAARVATRAAAVAAALIVTACGNVTLKTPLDERAPVDPANPGRYGLESHLRALGSGIQGKARVVDRADGVTLSLSMINLPQGPYRVAFGENANCTSPNGFSAGKPWAPVATGKAGRDLVPPLFQSNDGSAEASVFLRGVRTTGPDGVEKRSIVVYTGKDVTDAQPDVPNNRIACGTFEPARPFQF
jgi:Cu/Zn superoxide dismutase